MFCRRVEVVGGKAGDAAIGVGSAKVATGVDDAEGKEQGAVGAVTVGGYDRP